MSKNPNKKAKPSRTTAFKKIKTVQGFEEYVLETNGLRVLYHHMPGTGVVTSNIVYRVGARDEIRGETGLAHMLEHMLFKPTKNDLKRKVDSGAMQFERDTGCTLNANTWKDRTCYYFSYPREYTKQALAIEADRMQNVVLTDTEFLPERGNVLSEFDMYFGNPEFAISVAVVGTAFHSHPYGHETIGYREDIEDYTVEKLERLYRLYYRPDNAALMIVGDINCTEALGYVEAAFGKLKNPKEPIPRIVSREPKQEGKRLVTISRPSDTNVVAFGLRHDGFPSRGWYETSLALSVLAVGPESILHKLLIDTGKASELHATIEPTGDPNLAIIYVSFGSQTTHAEIEEIVSSALARLDKKNVTALIKKAIAHQITDEHLVRASSLSIANELTEHIAAGEWSSFTNTIETLRSITPNDVQEQIAMMFEESTVTMGHFIGKK